MWEEILNQAINVGFFAVLFVGLMVYILRDTAKRESKYVEMINKLHDSLSVVGDIQKQTKAISDSLLTLNKDVTQIKTTLTIKKGSAA